MLTSHGLERIARSRPAVAENDNLRNRGNLCGRLTTWLTATWLTGTPQQPRDVAREAVRGACPRRYKLIGVLVTCAIIAHQLFTGNSARLSAGLPSQSDARRSMEQPHQLELHTAAEQFLLRENCHEESGVRVCCNAYGCSSQGKSYTVDQALEVLASKISPEETCKQAVDSLLCFANSKYYSKGKEISRAEYFRILAGKPPTA